MENNLVVLSNGAIKAVAELKGVSNKFENSVDRLEKLTNKLIKLEILKASKATAEEIAKLFNISVGHVYSIRANKRWKVEKLC